MQVICIEEPAFYELIDTVYSMLKEKHDATKERWVAPADAMLLLNIKSKTTLQVLRDSGKIRFTQPQKRVILYDRVSIEEYLEKHAKNTF